MPPKRHAGSASSKSSHAKQADIAKFFGGGSKPHSTAIKANVITPSHSSADSPRVKRQKQPEAALEPRPALRRLKKAGSEPVAGKETPAELLDTGPPDSTFQQDQTAIPPSSYQASPPTAPALQPSQGSPLGYAAPAPPQQALSQQNGHSSPRISTSSQSSRGHSSLAEHSPEEHEKEESSPASKQKKAVLRRTVDVPKASYDILLSTQIAIHVTGVGKGAIAAAEHHSKFDAQQRASWKPGEAVPFPFLVETFIAIEATSKRLEIVNILTNALRTIIATTPEDLLPTVYLFANRVAPAHQGVELGIGDAILIKALASVTGRKEATIKADASKAGDLSAIANTARGKQATLGKITANTVRSVFKTFKDIAKIEGSKSQEYKKQLIMKLLGASGKGGEAGYIIRLLQGKLRIGLQEQGLLAALAQSVLLEREGASNRGGGLAQQLEEASQIVKQVYSECPTFDELVPALLEAPIKDLPLKVHFKPGLPIKAMLAKPTNGISEVLDKFQDSEFTVEYKYDGERAQVHVDEAGHVSIYSRNSENSTGKYPDLAARMPSHLQPGVNSIVIDGEVVAYDVEEDRMRPFQILSTRKRKDVDTGAIKVQVALFAFDCLFLDGQSLLSRPLTERREALISSLNPRQGELQFATFKTSHDVEELGNFLNEAVAAGTEGLIVKSMDSTYEPSKRSVNWLKLKKDYLEGVGDTFDVVPIGAWHGRGKRTGVYGSYLLAIYDDDNEEFQTISKIGTGFSEELLKTLHSQLSTHAIDAARPYYRYGESLVPEIWFDAQVVWEVKAADLSISPLHKAATGLVDPSKGISIRFPRLVRTREDKRPEQATSPDQVADMYKKQVIQSRNKPAPDNNDA